MKRFSSTIIGCRSSKEVDEICDAFLSEVPADVWKEFDALFGDEVNDLDWETDHWRYIKKFQRHWYKIILINVKQHEASTIRRIKRISL